MTLEERKQELTKQISDLENKITNYDKSDDKSESLESLLFKVRDFKKELSGIDDRVKSREAEQLGKPKQETKAEIPKTVPMKPFVYDKEKGEIKLENTLRDRISNQLSKNPSYEKLTDSNKEKVLDQIESSIQSVVDNPATKKKMEASKNAMTSLENKYKKNYFPIKSDADGKFEKDPSSSIFDAGVKVGVLYKGKIKEETPPSLSKDMDAYYKYKTEYNTLQSEALKDSGISSAVSKESAKFITKELSTQNKLTESNNSQLSRAKDIIEPMLEHLPDSEKEAITKRLESLNTPENMSKSSFVIDLQGLIDRTNKSYAIAKKSDVVGQKDYKSLPEATPEDIWNKMKAVSGVDKDTKINQMSELTRLTKELKSKGVDIPESVSSRLWDTLTRSKQDKGTYMNPEALYKEIERARVGTSLYESLAEQFPDKDVRKNIVRATSGLNEDESTRIKDSIINNPDPKKAATQFAELRDIQIRQEALEDKPVTTQAAAQSKQKEAYELERQKNFVVKDIYGVSESDVNLNDSKIRSLTQSLQSAKNQIDRLNEQSKLSKNKKMDQYFKENIKATQQRVKDVQTKIAEAEEKRNQFVAEASKHSQDPNAPRYIRNLVSASKSEEAAKPVAGKPENIEQTKPTTVALPEEKPEPISSSDKSVFNKTVLALYKNGTLTDDQAQDLIDKASKAQTSTDLQNLTASLNSSKKANDFITDKDKSNFLKDLDSRLESGQLTQNERDFYAKQLDEKETLSELDDLKTSLASVISDKASSEGQNKEYEKSVADTAERLKEVKDTFKMVLLTTLQNRLIKRSDFAEMYNAASETDSIEDIRLLDGRLKSMTSNAAYAASVAEENRDLGQYQNQQTSEEMGRQESSAVESPAPEPTPEADTAQTKTEDYFESDSILDPELLKEKNKA